MNKSVKCAIMFLVFIIIVIIVVVIVASSSHLAIGGGNPDKHNNATTYDVEGDQEVIDNSTEKYEAVAANIAHGIGTWNTTPRSTWRPGHGRQCCPCKKG